MPALSKIRLLISIALILPTARTLSQSPNPPRSSAPTAPPKAPVRTVVDDYFGTRLEDPYRYMEDLNSAEMQAWFKAQNDYTRSVLARIPGRGSLLKRLKELNESAVARVYDLRRLPGEHYFYQKRLASEEMGKVYARNGINAPEKLIVDPVKITPAGSPAFVLNYYSPSYDASKVAYGASPGGSEDAVIHIVDVATGRESPETIDRSWLGFPSWLPDGHAFLHNRMQKMLPGMPVTEREQKSTVYLHVPGTDPETDRAIFGYNVSPRVKIAPADLPFATPVGESPWLFGYVVHGVQLELTVYAAPLTAINDRDIPWRKIVDVDDQVTTFDIHGDDIYLLSHKDAPRFKVLRTSISNPDFAHATVVVPESDVVLRNVTAAKDALYVLSLDGGIGKVLRIPFSGPNAGVATRLSLPVDGQVWFDAIDPRVDGALLGITSWNRAASDYAYDPATNQITETTLVPHGPFDFPSDVVADEVKAPSYDGTLIPLSIVHKKGIALDGTNPTLLDGYGSYGVTMDPYFDPLLLAWIERGGVYAVAHVRGGGEYGEGWHLAGKLLTKHNTWRDFIAAAQYLIDHKYTSTARLAGEGTSAGGITIGRAITERPDLFAAAIDNVGLSDVVRVEESANGVPNIPEFGTYKTPEGFRAVYEMSTYHHIKDGTPYPAVLVTTGINDPRVAPWEPAKLVARLQAATSSGKAVLLRVEYEGGHGGIAMTKTQLEQLLADQWSFLLWQFGAPDFQPAK